MIDHHPSFLDNNPLESILSRSWLSPCWCFWWLPRVLLFDNATSISSWSCCSASPSLNTSPETAWKVSSQPWPYFSITKVDVYNILQPTQQVRPSRYCRSYVPPFIPRTSTTWWKSPSFSCSFTACRYFELVWGSSFFLSTSGAAILRYRVQKKLYQGDQMIWHQ